MSSVDCPEYITDHFLGGTKVGSFCFTFSRVMQHEIQVPNSHYHSLEKYVC